jgi:hypothetical protein
MNLHFDKSITISVLGIKYNDESTALAATSLLKQYLQTNQLLHKIDGSHLDTPAAHCAAYFAIVKYRKVSRLYICTSLVLLSKYHPYATCTYVDIM